ncbi:elongin A, like [Brachyhypopomus gauderio]|uniref:elongin A, like n=1 Tax=Brachyhypopomus gauderio TaxID=698409 RepID=UPI004042BDA5
MASADVEKVLQLKLQLKESTEGKTLLRTLKKLQELDITLDILAETGIGKVVNSFRKHDDAGQMAKTLVHRWKKLVPKEASSSNVVHLQSLSMKEDDQQTDREENGEDTRSNSEVKHTNEGKPSKIVDDKSQFKSTMVKSKDVIGGKKKDSTKKEYDMGHILQTSKKSSKPSKETLASDCHKKKKYREQKHIDKDSNIMNKQQSKISKKQKNNSLKEDDLNDGHEKKRDAFNKKDHEEKKRKEQTSEDLQIEEFETPSMSFEAYLNYDLEAPKRKKKSCDGRNPKHLKTNQKEDIKVCEVSNVKMSKSAMEATLGSKGSVLDLLKVPLPEISPECEDLSQYQYLTEKKVEKATDIYEEAPPAMFTGQRFNKKMQVYSGSKTAYLPSMMTLYQQCIRTLQNNIDLLYEIGGVPFELLEPVLERCRPEQLLRIENCNPVYIGVTDHLWEKHCHRDFRNAQLEEYEAWREMYLRLSEERERKLQQLTRTIVSAHSGKPKGRQVKMAFIHSAAKPPRSVRVQQELHGTAGPAFPHPTDKASGKSHENRGRLCFSEPPKPPSTCSGNSQSQDPRKIRRVAPMMAKSLKAFKKQRGRR